MSFAIAHGHFVHLHACADGGERKKKTAFLCSEVEFMVLEKFCDGTHPHIKNGGSILRRASLTLPKKLNIQRPYVSSMPMFWNDWRLVPTYNVQQSKGLKRCDLNSKQRVARCHKLFLNLLPSAQSSPTSCLPSTTRRCCHQVGTQYQQGPNFFELKQKGVISICMFLVSSEGCKTLWKLLSSYGILLTN